MARGNFQKAGNQRQKKVSADKIVKYVIKGRGRGNRKVTTSFKTKKRFSSLKARINLSCCHYVVLRQGNLTTFQLQQVFFLSYLSNQGEIRKETNLIFLLQIKNISQLYKTIPSQLQNHMYLYSLYNFNPNLIQERARQTYILAIESFHTFLRYLERIM